jgi:hypothetical protein
MKRRAKTKSPTVDRGGKDFLTEAEMKRFLDTARGSRHGTRDHAMMLMTYRHGLRVSELIDLRLKDIDLGSARLYVRRKKDSLSTHQPIEGGIMFLCSPTPYFGKNTPQGCEMPVSEMRGYEMPTLGLKSTHKSPNIQPIIGGFASLRRTFSNAALVLIAVLLMCAVTERGACAAEHEFQICHGYFALCAASTCKPTRKKIEVNVSGDGTALFPEADCTCPIFSGDAIADLVGGNMKGSCEPPSPDQIWSTFAVRSQIPQEINGWVPSGPKPQHRHSSAAKTSILGGRQ